MKNLVNKGFKYFVAIMMVFSLMSMNAWANGPESGTSSETGSTTTENKGTTKDTGDSQGDTADQLISNEEKKTNTSKESDDKEGQTDQTTDKKTDYTYEDKKISVKAVLANASAISDQAELRVKEIPESTTEYKKYQEALNKKSNLYSNVLLYDISFILDGKEVEPTDGNVKVSMSFKDQQLSDDLNVKDNNDLKVIHFKDNDVNKQESLKTTTSVKNETTSFETKSFSVVAFTSDMITSISMQKKNNGKWEDSKEFNPGDPFRMTMNFHLMSKSLEKGSTLTYQLPENVTVPEKREGEVLDKYGTSFGHFVVGTDGKITITLNDNFNTETDYTGKLNFLGEISKDAAKDQDETIKFAETNTTITIKKNGNGGSGDQNTDSKVTKTGKVSDDKKSVNYTVTVSTTKGTGNQVTIKDSIDWVQNVTANYDENSFRLVKNPGNQPIYYDTSKLQFNEYNGTNFTLSDLPELKAGESYELNYKVNLTETANSNGNVKINNSASDNKQTSNSNIEVSKAMVSKSGSQDGNRIIWKVFINEDRHDLSKYVFSDKLPEGLELTAPAVVKDVTNSWNEIKELENTQSGDKTIKIDFSKLSSKDKTHEYYIEYYTNGRVSATPGNTEKVLNTGVLTDGSHDYESSTSVGYQPFSVSKTPNGYSVDGDHLINKWKANVKLSGQSISEFTYKDIIENAKDSDNKDLGKDSHFTTASQLKKEIEGSIKLKSNSGDISANDYSWELKCFDANNGVISNDDTSKHVKSFTLQFKKKDNKDFKPTEMNISYTTTGNISSIPDGKEWKFGNNGKLNTVDGKTTTVPENHQEISYKKQLEKQASVTNEPKSYQDAGEVNYDQLKEENGKKFIYYRILLDINKGQQGDIVVTDTLPKGLKYVDKSLYGKFYGGEWDLKDENYNNNSYDFRKNEPSISTISNADGTTTLTMTVNKGYEMQYNDQKILLCYKAYLSDDLETIYPNKTYENTASWNGSTTTQKTKVIVDEISKKGTQLKDSNGQWLNQISYNLEINRTHKDLNSMGDTLTLVDKLNSPDGVAADLDLSSLKLYQYDDTKDKNIGDPIDNSLYTFTYDKAKHEISMELPDEMACVLVYTYNIDTGNLANAQDIKNDVKLGGKYSKSSTTEMKIADASASIAYKKLKIKKVDSKDYTKSLKGAKFKISERVNSEWKEVEKDLTTDDQGEINITNLGSEKLYKIEETDAPDGYEVNKTPYYAMLLPGENTSLSNDYISRFYGNLNQDIKNCASQDKITFVGESGATIIVPDTYTKLTVDKSWVDKNGKSTTPGSSVKVKLYRYSKPSVKVTIKHNEWEKTELFIAPNTSVTIKITSRDDSATIKDGNGIDHGKEYTIGPFTKDTEVRISKSWSTDYYYTSPQINEKNKVPVGDPITLDAGCNWSHTWENLPPKDSKTGFEYSYKIEEEPVAGYKTTYRGNVGTTSGTIHVINQETGDKKYTLPSTGGKGTHIYSQVGMLLSMLGIIYVLIKKIKGGKFKKEQHS